MLTPAPTLGHGAEANLAVEDIGLVKYHIKFQ